MKSLVYLWPIEGTISRVVLKLLTRCIQALCQLLQRNGTTVITNAQTMTMPHRQFMLLPFVQCFRSSDTFSAVFHVSISPRYFSGLVDSTRLKEKPNTPYTACRKSRHPAISSLICTVKQIKCGNQPATNPIGVHSQLTQIYPCDPALSHTPGQPCRRCGSHPAQSAVLLSVLTALLRFHSCAVLQTLQTEEAALSKTLASGQTSHCGKERYME